MSDYADFLVRFADGTIRQRSPFADIEVWNVPGRSAKPAAVTTDCAKQEVEKREPEAYCDLCEAKYFNTPPEKERLVFDGGRYVSMTNLSAGKLAASKPIFRRIPNLLEIVTFDYWRSAFGIALSPENERRKEEYISDREGRFHVLNAINIKLKKLGKDPLGVDDKQKLAMADAFFGGGHELIVAGRHFVEGLRPDAKPYSAGEMTSDDHFQFMKFTVGGMKSCYDSNSRVRYVAVFQNWLKPAGASFDHLHKQIVAADTCGPRLDRMLAAVRANPDVFRQMGPLMAAEFHLAIAENDHALAFADIGNMYPTVTIQSKNEAIDPRALSDVDIRGMSDIVHAIHRAIGNAVPCNEEWYYAPIDSGIAMPWRICIKQRINTPAGFEGVTGIYISPIDPWKLRQDIVRGILDAAKAGVIAGNIHIAEK